MPLAFQILVYTKLGVNEAGEHTEETHIKEIKAGSYYQDNLDGGDKKQLI